MNERSIQSLQVQELDQPAPKFRGSLAACFLTILTGLVITGLMYVFFTDMDRQKVTERLHRGTDAMIAFISSPVQAPNPALDQIFNTIFTFAAEVSPDQEITQELLESYLWDTVPFGLETSTIEYLPRVRFSEKNELRAMFGGAVDNGFSITEQDGQSLVPAADRDEYYPVLFEATLDQSWATPGLDRGNLMTQRIAMEQARNLGMFVTHTYWPLLGDPESNQMLETHYYLPLYKTGIPPETVEERREQIRGFISIASYFPIDENTAAFFADEIQGFSGAFFPNSDTWYQSSKPADLSASMDQGLSIETPYQLLNMPWVAVTTANPEMVLSAVTSTRYWTLGLGLLLTLWVAGMILWSRSQSLRMVGLVSARTRDLVEKTHELSELNRALGESESRYRMLADHASDVIFTHDLDGIVTYISPSVVQQTGFDVSDYVGYPVSRHMAGEYAALVKQRLKSFRELIDKDPTSLKDHYVFEYELLAWDGSIVPVETKLSLLYDRNGKINGFLGVSRNIADRRKNEREKQELEDAFRQSQKLEAIGTLAGGVAHDFNNLLVGILGHAEMLKLKLAGNDEVGKGLDVIEKAALRAKELTAQLLGFARKGRYQAVPVNLNEAVADVVTLIERTFDKKIKVNCHCNHESPIFIGDPGQINQLILNLAVNARDAMPQGGDILFTTGVITLDEKFCRMNPDLSPGLYSVVTVSDTGIGMTQAKIARIFEPFFTDKENGSGTGMGLAMVYGVVKNHGGAVTVDSEPGKGTSFTLYFPFSDSMPESRPSIHNPRELVRGSGNILVVDDESLVRDMAQNMLDRLGYSVMLAEDGDVAVASYHDNWRDIDLVIMDMVMPSMSGLDCVQKMRAINPEVKVILATGYSKESLTEKINQDDVQGFLQKPFRMQELSDLVLNTI